MKYLLGALTVIVFSLSGCFWFEPDKPGPIIDAPGCLAYERIDDKVICVLE